MQASKTKRFNEFLTTDQYLVYRLMIDLDRQKKSILVQAYVIYH